jgi:UDP-N-acetylmuramyl pentapeptide phosphotransferase/UDP-N-acetylglucosamine-1-phosphate transferase
MTWIVIPAVAFSLATFGTWLLSRPDALPALLAQPNERSLHTRPTPASGGIAIFFALLAVAGLTVYGYPMPAGFVWLAAGAVLVAGVSLVDDWRPVSPLARLLAHLLAAGLLLAGGGFAPEMLHWPGGGWHWPGWLGVTAGFLFTAWMLNLYNFMDGMDGFAGGMAVFGFTAYALLGAEQLEFALISLSIAAAAAGFLLFNFPPARIFMGDTGSSLLGFLAAALALWAERENLFPLWLAALVFSPFIVDATVTLLRRLWQGEKIWQAHKTHYYQRLVQLGWGHSKTVTWEYLLMAAASLSALGASLLEPLYQWSILAGWAVLYTGLAYWVRRMERG